MLQTDTARRLDAALPELHPAQFLWITLQAERLAGRQRAADTRAAWRTHLERQAHLESLRQETGCADG